jgi:hypothetical protein
MDKWQALMEEDNKFLVGKEDGELFLISYIMTLSARICSADR